MSRTAALLPALRRALPSEALDVDDLEAQLGPMLDEALATWPDLGLSEGDFLRDLGACIARKPPESLRTWLERLRAEDLYLARACARGIEPAIAAFEARYDNDLRHAARRFEGQSWSRDDLRQALREKLFVGSNTADPKIESYLGQGYLQNWLRVTAVRTFIDIVRGNAQRKRETPTDDERVFDLADPELDLELEFLKREYRAEFKAAFADAMHDIGPAHRNMLRYHLVDRLNIDQIGAIYGVHRATAARRLGKAREALLHHTREQLMGRLHIDRDEYDSIMALINSRLDVSMHRLLETSVVLADEAS